MKSPLTERVRRRQLSLFQGHLLFTTDEGTRAAAARGDAARRALGYDLQLKPAVFAFIDLSFFHLFAAWHGKPPFHGIETSVAPSDRVSQERAQSLIQSVRVNRRSRQDRDQGSRSVLRAEYPGQTLRCFRATWLRRLSKHGVKATQVRKTCRLRKHRGRCHRGLSSIC